MRQNIGVFILFTLYMYTIFSNFLFTDAQVQQMLNKLACIEHEECGACLSAASHCRWCADPYYKETAPRCNDDKSLVEAGCSQGSIQRPQKAIFEISENSSLQDMQPGLESVVQIQPQKVRISLKPRETKKIRFSFRPAKNYPLDLYYLMDLTWSMKDDKETLVSLQDDLPKMLKNLTDNFRLGFGSFADKPISPFISMNPERLKNPCAVEGEACEATYSYKHQLSLTDQVNEFIEKVNKSSVTANLDNAEAQLDALVQVITCGEKIGWSLHSRKIIILLSDGLLHTAGDGKLGGAIKRNDEKCHLDENGYYRDSTIYDYPSIPQIYRLLDEYKVNIIFAVTESVKEHYDRLHELLKDFTYVAKLESDSSNILNLVKMGYEEVMSIVDFEDDSSGIVTLKYFTDCGQETALMETTRCTDVEIGKTINYEVHVTLDSCPEYKMINQTIRIAETQLGQDSLTLDLEIQCGCECQSGTQEDVVLPTCYLNSRLVCGVCLCNEGWSGPTCNCSIEDDLASATLMSQCRETNVTHAMTCSGKGECICGKCICDDEFNGKYCQCKDCALSRDNRLECGGAGRGDCVCGRCVCAADWTGDACDCIDNVDACVAPADTRVCSGHGECLCGKCQCSAAEDKQYAGTFCETCAGSNCKNPLCLQAEPCVECYLAHNCTKICTIGDANYTVSENYDTVSNDEERSCVLRQYVYGTECQYRYTYNVSTEAMVTLAIIINSMECAQTTTAKLMMQSVIIIAAVIFMGILIIVGVKCAQITSDKRAYEKFLKEAEESRLNAQELNPLYISPITEFRLPDSFPREQNE